MKLQQWAGIDVSSKALEVFVRASQTVLNVGNSSGGLATLVTAELEQLISNNPIWKDLSELLCSTPGIGPVVSATAGDSDWRVD
jgi:hypothetical protein